QRLVQCGLPGAAMADEGDVANPVRSWMHCSLLVGCEHHSAPTPATPPGAAAAAASFQTPPAMPAGHAPRRRRAARGPASRTARESVLEGLFLHARAQPQHGLG